MDQIRQAAELHDVGKVAIPDAILEKRTPLDESEWGFIRRHTLIGERIIAAAPDLRGVATLVRSSHESFGGGGYPEVIERLMKRFMYSAGILGAMQIGTLVIMTKLAAG